MKILLKILPAIMISLLVLSCEELEESQPELKEGSGTLKIGIALQIEKSPAGRTAEVNTGDFIVRIWDVSSGTMTVEYNPFSSAPAETELPTGTYYVTAESPYQVDAGFDSPYYFGQSDNFTIDTEEIKTINVDCSLANSMVSFNYSQNVLDNFTTWNARVAVPSASASLDFPKDETRPGYFSLNPLDIEVYLSYTKLDGNTIDRTLTTTIMDPQSRTHYKINVDASLADGQIVININVDETVNEVDIDLSDGSTPPPPSSWVRVFGGSGNDEALGGVIATPDGGYFMGGWTQSSDYDVSFNHGNSDIWVVKTDSNGNLEWQKSLGGSANEECWDVFLTLDDGFLVVGSTQSSDGDVSSKSNTNYNYWAVKLDASGNLEWENTYFYNSNAHALAYAADNTSDGGFMLTGYTYVDNTNRYDVWIVKIDANGNPLWNQSFGGTSFDYSYGIKAVSDGGYVVSGMTLSNDGDVSGNHGSEDFWVIKLDSNGNLLWQNTLGGSGSEYAYDLEEISDGYMVAGYTTSNNFDVTGHHGGNDFWVVKLDFNGSIIWQKAYGGSGHETARDISLSNDGNIMIAGDTGSTNGDISSNDGGYDFWLVKIDPDGNIQWDKTYGSPSSETGYGVSDSPDGGFILSGITYGAGLDIPYHYGSNDYVLFKIDQNGNL